MKIDFARWATFRFVDVFDVRKGFYNKKPVASGEGSIPFLSATSEGNGVTGYYTLDEIINSSRTGDDKHEPLDRKLFPGHAVCVTNNGSVGFAYYQPDRFTCSHDVNPLYRLDGDFNEATGLFVASVIMKDRYRWAYGRKWRPERMLQSTLDLPATDDGKPDWKWMERYIRSLHSKPLTTSQAVQAHSVLTPFTEWSEYRLGDLFDSVYKVRSYHIEDLEERDQFSVDVVPYVTRTEFNNGVKSLVSSAGLRGVEDGNAIVVGDTTATISYQPGPFVAGEHIVAARAGWLNVYTGLFVVCLLKKERFRYSYGRAFKIASILDTTVRLPTSQGGEPDWQAIEFYVKSLPYGDRLI